MGNTENCTIIGGFDIIKNKVDTGNDIDIDLITKTMSAYTQKDLYLFRDCIELMLLYYNR